MKQPIEVDERCQHLIDEVSDIMDKADGNYGTFLMEELQKRLECVVRNFNEELKALIDDSIKKMRMKDFQLRALMDTSMQIKSDQSIKEKTSVLATPDFIKDVKFGPIRSK